MSRDEVARVIAATRNLKHQTALSVAYGAGLRASEVIGTSLSGGRATAGASRFVRFVHGFYEPALLETFYTKAPNQRIERAVTTVLSGGVFFHP